MNEMGVSNTKPLDYALVQCLRLFAQQGRRIRKQKSNSKECVSDGEMIQKMPTVLCNKSTTKTNGEILHPRQVVK